MSALATEQIRELVPLSRGGERNCSLSPRFPTCRPCSSSRGKTGSQRIPTLKSIAANYTSSLYHFRQNGISRPEPTLIQDYDHGEWTRQQGGIEGYYADSTNFAGFTDERGWVAPYFIAYLIAKGPLANKELDILDVGCHHSNLLTAMRAINEESLLNIKGYTGMDLSKSAIAHSRKLFPQYQYVAGDALDANSYSGIPNKKLIVCSGVCDYLPPSKIKSLLNNLHMKLDDDMDARIYLTYRTASPEYGVDEVTLRRLPRHNVTYVEDGIEFHALPDPASESLTLYNYDSAEFRKMVEEAGLEIDRSNSQSCPSVSNIWGSDYDYICLKRKPLN